MKKLNLSPPHLRQMNVSHVSGTQRVLFVENRPYFEVSKCVQESHHQTAGYALWSNLAAVNAGYRYVKNNV